MKAKDPHTGEEFEPKKRSQKFACPANRIKYNNKKSNDLRIERSYIEAPLNKNHKLLKQLMGSKNEDTFDSNYLLGYGINFNVFNHYFKVGERAYPSVYEFMIITTPNSSTVKILRNDRL
jgi:hypothetical protein